MAAPSSPSSLEEENLMLKREIEELRKRLEVDFHNILVISEKD
jgi:hypothetical protein